MEFNEIYEKTVFAFEHDEVFELLTGQKGYAYQEPRYVAAVPTCDEFIFRDGIYPLYKTLDENQATCFLEKLCDAFNRMIASDDSTMIWWAVSMLQGQKDQETYFKKSPFFIADLFWTGLRESLYQHKQRLIDNKAYQGASHNDGLWAEVMRISRLLNADYGICLI